jgi:FkbM family methyltransferase
MATLYCRWCTGTCNWVLWLRAAQQNGFSPHAILDIGACRGDWTNVCKMVFPSAKIMMIEPLADKLEMMTYLTLRHSGVSFRPVLLGASARSRVDFYEQDSLSSIYPFVAKSWQPSCQLDMHPLDEVVAQTEFAKSDLIKIHVQGSELEVLKGAEETLKQAEIVFVLVSLIELYEGSPLFHDVTQFMAERDFRVYDVVHFYRRELDGATAQLDVVFAKNSSPLLMHRGW